MRVAFVAVLLSSLGLGAGLARADRPRVNVEITPPGFYPETQFPYNGGYYTTPDGYYYHYDRDRHGWHYGRNHIEGLRWERREHWRHRHDRD
jgi:hypothetical protein